MSQHPDRAFKILTADQWAAFVADGVFHGAPIDLEDGYIHMSTAFTCPQPTSFKPHLINILPDRPGL